MKQALVVAGLFVAVSGSALAQGSEIVSRWGPSGSHCTLSPGQQTFSYDATISGATAPYEVKLEVFHNGVSKFTNSVLGAPFVPFDYLCPVPMGTWNICSGDTVTFVLKVIDTASGATLATHHLYGDVAGR